VVTDLDEPMPSPAETSARLAPRLTWIERSIVLPLVIAQVPPLVEIWHFEKTAPVTFGVDVLLMTS
jgi:hypothetical protein